MPQNTTDVSRREPQPRTTSGRAVQVYRRPRSRGKAVLGIFAATAAFGFVAVTMVDPTSGVSASSYVEKDAQFGGTAAQSVVASSNFQYTITRDGYEAIAPPPPPPPAATTGSSSSSGGAPAAGVPDPGTAQAVAYGMMASYGWGDDQYSCLVSLWNRESGWNVYAYNASSGATGIPQALPGSKMASAGADWATNPATQITWGLGYVTSRYGTPCGAWAHSESVGWY